MTTVVYQSYRDRGAPAWLERCMASVRDWAQQQGHAYRFQGDALFGRVPAWFRERVHGNVLLMADLARLLAVRELLAEGAECVLWIDADVLVFEPARFAPPLARPYSFCHEVLVWPGDDGAPRARQRINNAVMSFRRDQPVLDFYVYALELLARRDGEVPHDAGGTGFLTGLARALPLPLTTTVAMYAAPVLADLAGAGDGRSLDLLRREAREPPAAANLCLSQRDKTPLGVTLDDALYRRVVERSLARA